MNTELERELIEHIISTVKERDNFEELHYHAFNEDYYIIGYWNAEQWLKKHNISAFKALDKIAEYEIATMGEQHFKKYDAESVVNFYVYIVGEFIINSLGDISELSKNEIIDLLGDL